MQPSETLRRTKYELLARGWFQGGYVDPVTGAVCLEGALHCAISNEPMPFRRAQGQWIDAKSVLVRVIGDTITDWNDRCYRTPEQVLDALDAAIRLAEQQEAAEPVPCGA